MHARVATVDPAHDAAGMVEQVRILEDLKAACAAVQARVTAAFAALRKAECSAVDGPDMREVDSTDQAALLRRKAARLARRSAGAEIALARRESPQRGGRFVGFAEALVAEMPRTLAALGSGLLSEWRATVIVRETACLTRELRAEVDAEIAGDPGRLDGLSDSRLQAWVKKVVCRLDAEAVVNRARRAVQDRRVSLRPAPDNMGYLTQLLPLGTAVACYAALKKASEQVVADGQSRSGAQLMADVAVARLMGVAEPHADVVPGRIAREDPVEVLRRAYTKAKSGTGADGSGAVEPGESRQKSTVPPPALPTVPSTAPPAVSAHGIPDDSDVVINLIVNDSTLFGDGDEPAVLPGNIPIPAPLARRMVAELPRDANVWIRRLYTRPRTGELVSMDSRQRTFTPAMRRLLIARDQDTCRTPWCNAPARHADHVVPAAVGGRTSLLNGQALSEDCNYIRTAPGWNTQRLPDGTMEVTAPTGHRYSSPVPSYGAPNDGVETGDRLARAG